jgi:exodeoxyribonuclease VIII
MNRIDVVIDLETLGTGPDAIITQIGMVEFDITTGKIGRKYLQNVDAQSCLDLGMKLDLSTLKWWLSQDLRVFKNSLERGLELPAVLLEVNNWLFAVSNKMIGAIYLWGNGASFDNVLLKGAFDRCKYKYPIKYYNDRDMRTIVDLAAIKMDIDPKLLKNKIEFKGTKHNAVDDCVWEAEVISMCYNILLN